MKPPSEVASLKPCVHGGEIFQVAEKYGLDPRELLDFSANINPLGPPPEALEAVKASLWEVSLYPETDSAALRRALAQHVGGLTSENVILGNGSTELIHLFAQVFLRKGSRAVIPSPTFGEYEAAVLKAGGKPVFVEAGEDFSFQVDKILGKVDSRTVMVFLCNPNNPTGALMPAEELISLIEKAEEKGILVFLDEDCMDFVEDGKRFSLSGNVEKHPNLFTLRSFTKFYGMPGLRIGYGFASKKIIEPMLGLKIPWNVNCLAQAAALQALKAQDYPRKTRELIQKERLFLMEELKGFNNLRVYPTEANFILIDIEGSGLTAAQLKEKMLRQGILIRDCSSFRGLSSRHVRVAVRSRRENLRLLEALRKVLKNP
ncbi:threonine-phosphate decarboxylase CobD [Candidatus Hecatella orcuttiae]|uniref:threonine-phosphate decarboxylase CobD n=1 Tax=Candidatus Hecatella orcuttiae TaxID=1935119 RepID=UPI002867B2C5|nr:threonine-phosphate decarboxylase CobD [Candidatus Hecatella orcuttiae]